MSAQADWIAVDWGTSNLRIWAMGADGRVLGADASGKGMGGLAPDEFEPTLLELAGPFLAPDRVTEVLICGMAGARQGWAEAPYLPAPCAPTGAGSVTPPTKDARVSVRILPGLCQSEPPDVMRGEETQIAGFLAGNPDFDGTACLPGTHSKWVRLRAGRVEQFRTAMTGEAFALFSGNSVLRHSMDEAWHAAAFLAAIDETTSRPEALATALFSVRARGLLAKPTPGEARARLSGLLVGAELAATRAFWQDRPVVLIGAPSLTARYATALAHLGAREVQETDGAGLALAGLRAARERMMEDKWK